MKIKEYEKVTRYPPIKTKLAEEKKSDCHVNDNCIENKHKNLLFNAQDLMYLIFEHLSNYNNNSNSDNDERQFDDLSNRSSVCSHWFYHVLLLTKLSLLKNVETIYGSISVDDKKDGKGLILKNCSNKIRRCIAHVYGRHDYRDDKYDLLECVVLNNCQEIGTYHPCLAIIWSNKCEKLVFGIENMTNQLCSMIVNKCDFSRY